ncbi:MAG TPA: ATP-binding protein [Vitreimonas sp.]|uniref:ATP-binding protein n=1 Tax=Vitreimonas sp. TaxID=3069702 RepID=UPI002D4652C6|nr:ATP-binding protein [Vitreimonas sp.]HYD86769.1 ATP-binding protein [Vitreimonas sp.]
MATSVDEFKEKAFRVGSVFTPGSPINERDLFAGRLDQLSKIIDAVSQKGYHVVLYGERGVGKTSLANVLASFLRDQTPNVLLPRVNCDASDTFHSMWLKAFKDVFVTNSKASPGFNSHAVTEAKSLADAMGEKIGPDDVRRVLAQLSAGALVIFVFDEFDRVQNGTARTLMSDAIKALSDFGVSATIMLVGVADSVDALVVEHRSIERALVQIPMPRMTEEEIRLIIRNGLARLEMSIISDAETQLVRFSQGLPYITHLLCLHTARAALARRSDEIDGNDVREGIQAALHQWQQSIITAYYEATKSQQPGNIYREVLLACAFAQVDDLGYFSAAALRQPLNEITGRSYDIPNFARHLKELSQSGRGEMLQRVGAARKLRYRFKSPLMRPFIIMKGVTDGLVTPEQVTELSDG